jgi:hypothetical protein
MNGFNVPFKFKLAWALGGYLQAKGYTLTHLVNPNPVRLPPPPAKGNFVPDLLAKDKAGNTVLGIAVTSDGIATQETKGKLIEFSSRFHKETKQPVEFYIGMLNDPDAVTLLKRTFGEVHIDWKVPHIHIVKLTF